MRKGIVFGIQHFSIHDGTGIRTNIFLKGCPLRCLWCHNPEGLSMNLQLRFNRGRCVGCGQCFQVCTNKVHEYADGEHFVNNNRCTQCGRCLESCAGGALEIVGKYMSSDEVMAEVLGDKIFFDESGGGITVSGGEPVLQVDFLYELLCKAKENHLSVALETSGYARLEDYKRIMPYVDQFLWDYKETDPKKHKELTGVDNVMILNNLRYLHQEGKEIHLRCPIIPGINDTEDNFAGIAAILKELYNIVKFEIMPYHKLGISKNEKLGMQQQKEYIVPEDKTVEAWKSRIVELMSKSC